MKTNERFQYSFLPVILLLGTPSMEIFKCKHQVQKGSLQCYLYGEEGDPAYLRKNLRMIEKHYKYYEATKWGAFDKCLLISK